ncbi:MAG: hypothetical protein AAF802_33515 [Planctomycetota bacterium]
MALNMAKEVREMHKRTVRELRKQYADVFGEATNASNKDWLIKRCQFAPETVPLICASNGTSW